MRHQYKSVKPLLPGLLGSAIESLVHLKHLIIDSSPWRIADGLDDLGFVSTYFSYVENILNILNQL
jgi:hypothetical protein